MGSIDLISGTVQGVWIVFRDAVGSDGVNAFGKFIDHLEDLVGITPDTGASEAVSGSVSGSLGSSE